MPKNRNIMNQDLESRIEKLETELAEHVSTTRQEIAVMKTQINYVEKISNKNLSSIEIIAKGIQDSNDAANTKNANIAETAKVWTLTAVVLPIAILLIKEISAAIFKT